LKCNSITVVGLGSPHGDDAVGWHVANLLGESLRESRVHILKASVPHDIFDWVDSESEMHLIDALVLDVHDDEQCTRSAAEPAPEVERYQILHSEDEIDFQPLALCADSTEAHPAEFPRMQEQSVRSRSEQERCRFASRLRSGSTHHFDLLSTLRLAAQLRVLPESLTLWTIQVPLPFHRSLKPYDADPSQMLSPQAKKGAQRCAQAIAAVVLASEIHHA
jgi:hypothetical protein